MGKIVCDSCFHLKTFIWVTHSNFVKDIWITYSNVMKASMYYPEKAMATHSSTLTWKVLWMEEPSRLQSMRSLGVGHDWATSLSFFTFMHWRRKWQPTPVFFPGEGTGEPGGLPSMGSHRVGHGWSDLAAAAACIISLLLASRIWECVGGTKQFPLNFIFTFSQELNGLSMDLMEINFSRQKPDP